MAGEASVLSASDARHPTTVTVMRQRGAISSARPLYGAIQDPREATLLYHDLTVLKPYPLLLRGAFCPLDGGVRYTLTFRRAGRVVLTAVADPTGCDVIDLSPGGARWGGVPTFARWVPWGNPFWHALARVLHIPRVRDLWENPR